MSSDHDLLRQFAATRDEASFTLLVQRHLGFVHAVCRRRLRDAHAAQDATQAVFIALARKASAVANAPSVTGWLHRSACYETSNLMRSHANRLSRETEAHRLGTTSSDSRDQPADLDRVLDDVLCELSEADREAILARYFAGKSYSEIGTVLRLTENAARMRVDRAMGKLRDQLQRRGLTSTAAALVSALPLYSIAPAPSGMAAMITKASLAGVMGTTATIATIGLMSIGKVLTGAAIVVVLGGLAYQHHHASALKSELAAARRESSAATKQLDVIRQEIADLKRLRPVAVATSATPSSVSTATTVKPIVEPAPPPIPGVTPKAPKGWFQNGDGLDRYEVGVDTNNVWGGMPSAYAKSIGPADGKFGGMMQTIAADSYLDQRVKLTGWIKTEEVEKGAHLWLRVDGSEREKVLRFDNMNNRAPKGTTDWQEYSIVLDVPPEAKRLNYGFFVTGQGQMWVNGVTITPVEKNVPTTDMLTKSSAALPKTPINLGFSPSAPN